MADSEAVQNFINITGAPAQAASFYLESAKGDLETAINAYLEGGGSHAAASPVLDSPAPAASSPVRQYPPSSAPANQSPSSAPCICRLRSQEVKGGQQYTGTWAFPARSGQTSPAGIAYVLVEGIRAIPQVACSSACNNWPAAEVFVELMNIFVSFVLRAHSSLQSQIRLIADKLRW